MFIIDLKLNVNGRRHTINQSLKRQLALGDYISYNRIKLNVNGSRHTINQSLKRQLALGDYIS